MLKRPITLYWYERMELHRHKLTRECICEIVVRASDSVRWRCRAEGHDVYGYASLLEAKSFEITETKNEINKQQIWLGKLENSMKGD